MRKINSKILVVGIVSVICLLSILKQIAVMDEYKDDQVVKQQLREVMALSGDREYGQYLAGECVTCHQNSEHSGGIPTIIGLDSEQFITALLEYKSGKRTNEVMRTRAQNLTNEELAALASYFGKVEKKD